MTEGTGQDGLAGPDQAASGVFVHPTVPGADGAPPHIPRSGPFPGTGPFVTGEQLQSAYGVPLAEVAGNAPFPCGDDAPLPTAQPLDGPGPVLAGPGRISDVPVIRQVARVVAEALAAAGIEPRDMWGTARSAPVGDGEPSDEPLGLSTLEPYLPYESSGWTPSEPLDGADHASPGAPSGPPVDPGDHASTQYPSLLPPLLASDPPVPTPGGDDEHPVPETDEPPLDVRRLPPRIGRGELVELIDRLAQLDQLLGRLEEARRQAADASEHLLLTRRWQEETVRTLHEERARMRQRQHALDELVERARAAVEAVKTTTRSVPREVLELEIELQVLDRAGFVSRRPRPPQL